MEGLYHRGFFAHQEATSAGSARRIVPLLLSLIAPRSVADVGCGTGTWLLEFLSHGIADIHGFDGPWALESGLVIPRDRFSVVDLSRPLEWHRQYDLAMCIEVAEHVAPESAPGLVRSLASLSDCVVFSAAIPGQGGTGHVNEQWPEYWADHFRSVGLDVVDALRGRIWNDDDVSWWHAQNLLVFATPSHPAMPGLRAAETQATSALARVHPMLFRWVCETQPFRSELTVSQLLALMPNAIKRALRARLRHRT